MKHPLLYQLNTRVLLQERGAVLGRPATLDDIPDTFLEKLAAQGFEWVWFLGVWQTGIIGQGISRSQPELHAACQHCLPDLTDADICGSPFAIQSYSVHRDFGGNPALARLRKRLADHGLRLLLDFVPNHVAPDHPWVETHPEYFIRGTEEDLARAPQNYTRLRTARGERILAYGRDPYFPGWPDTLQLNYRHPACRDAVKGELARVAGQCDGVRCDMAMLVQPHVFLATWGDRALPADGSAPVDRLFWPEAIGQVRQQHPQFLFIAEVYWDLEWELQQAGFDFTYDKRLYDRLHSGAARPVREHLMAQPDFQEHSLRFLENHDEPRAAAVFGPKLRPAAVITFFIPGMRFFYEGQLEGRTTHVSMHVGRRPHEPVDAPLQAFYARLLECLQRPEVHQGQWRLWSCRPAWADNGTWDQFIVFSWEQGARRLLAAVNYGPVQGQCYVSLDVPGLAGRKFTLADLLGAARYNRDGDGLAGNGLFLDMPPWGFHLFELQEQKTAKPTPQPQAEAVLAGEPGFSVR
ncbi:MAG TPA: alpha-amylase family glycosyl hydrolase [Candidatus Sulfotelmatobacter sp.]|nr:alpha-amylase family glycosyl hydrolase [Candidatus Sulfotelmatobacter sp.]